MFLLWLFLLPSIVVVIVLSIFSNGKIGVYDCHVLGCNQSFGTMQELIDHLIDVHDYKIERYTDDD